MIYVIYNEDTDTYTCDEYIINRDWHGLTPQGNPMGGRWVLKDLDGKYLDHDRYRNDLFERNSLRCKY